MAFSYSLPPLLVNRSEHEIGRIIDQEVRAALRDFASWPQRMADPSWAENIDEDLVPPPEGAVNGVDVDGGAARLERKNATRREKYHGKGEGSMSKDEYDTKEWYD